MRELTIACHVENMFFGLGVESVEKCQMLWLMSEKCNTHDFIAFPIVPDLTLVFFVETLFHTGEAFWIEFAGLRLLCWSYTAVVSSCWHSFWRFSIPRRQRGTKARSRLTFVCSKTKVAAFTYTYSDYCSCTTQHWIVHYTHKGHREKAGWLVRRCFEPRWMKITHYT